MAVGVWLIHLSVAAAAAFPLWLALQTVSSPLPGADVLRRGIHLGPLVDLAELRPGLIGSVGLVGLAVAGFGLLVGAAVSGGVLEALRGGDARHLAHRFGSGAGRFFGRFVRLGLAVGALFGVVAVLGILPFAALTRASLREGVGAGFAGPLGVLLVAGLVFVVASLVLDAGRIHVVRSDGRARTGLWAGLASVGRRPGAWLGTGLLNAALVGVALVLYLLLRAALPTDTWPFILTALILQQSFSLTRCGLRVALVASELALVERQEATAGRPAPATGAAQAEPVSSSSPT